VSRNHVSTEQKSVRTGEFDLSGVCLVTFRETDVQHERRPGPPPRVERVGSADERGFDPRDPDVGDGFAGAGFFPTITLVVVAVPASRRTLYSPLAPIPGTEEEAVRGDQLNLVGAILPFGEGPRDQRFEHGRNGRVIGPKVVGEDVGVAVPGWGRPWCRCHPSRRSPHAGPGRRSRRGRRWRLSRPAGPGGRPGPACRLWRRR